MKTKKKTPNKKAISMAALLAEVRQLRANDVGSSRIWTTKHGEDIRIQDMKQDHLENTIIYLHKRMEDYERYSLGTYRINGLRAQSWIDFMRNELVLRRLG